MRDGIARIRVARVTARALKAMPGTSLATARPALTATTPPARPGPAPARPQRAIP